MKKTPTLIIGLFIVVFSQGQNIYTVAGNGTESYSGNGGAATAAELNWASGIAIDVSGNLYISDTRNNVIRKVTPSGIINNYAGNDTAGYSGDGGPATAAKLSVPAGLAIDALGSLYIADSYNNTIRKINTSGIITTIAGNGTVGYSGDGGPATSAEMEFPTAIALDDSGNIFISDMNNSVIRKINTAGIITTFAGTGYKGSSGTGGPATAAELGWPASVAVDKHGNVYIGDCYFNTLLKVNTSGIINNFVGNGSVGFTGDGGPASAAKLYVPIGLNADDSDNIYISDYYNYRIRKVNTSGIINTIAGKGTRGYCCDGGPATATEFDSVVGIVKDHSGNIFLADARNNRIREITKGSALAVNDISNTYSISVYPNPSGGIFNYEFRNDNYELQTLQVYNLLGECVYSKSLRQAQGDGQIDLSNEAKGIYFYRFISPDGNLISEGKLLLE